MPPRSFSLLYVLALLVPGGAATAAPRRRAVCDPGIDLQFDPNPWQTADGGQAFLAPAASDHLEAQYAAKTYTFTQPIDHHDERVGTFEQRYWVNMQHYDAKKGGPVILMDGGEVCGAKRWPILDTGIVNILAKATGGVGVLLEHRYYGEFGFHRTVTIIEDIVFSPSRPIISHPELHHRFDAVIPLHQVLYQTFDQHGPRWLTNAQALADSANFMAHVQLPGIAADLTAPGTPWIYYGASYSGARAAHMRVRYPALVYGAIASSAVTHAVVENWAYWDALRSAADPVCVAHIQRTISFVDFILRQTAPGTELLLKAPLRALFGVSGIKHDEDFANLLRLPLNDFELKQWTPAVPTPRFDAFCKALSKPLVGDGHGRIGPFVPTVSVYNYAKYIKEQYPCPKPYKPSDCSCYGTYDCPWRSKTDLRQTERSWEFQVCSEWGFFFPAPPDDYSQRSVVSKLITLKYDSKFCAESFPPGSFYRLPPSPNVTAVNELGGLDIAADRLAFISGSHDPWRPVTPHGNGADAREDTVLRPFKEIAGGGHMWDAFGLADGEREPAEVRRVHEEMVGFVKAWLEEWRRPEGGAEE